MIRYDPLFFFDDTRLAAENNGRRNAVHKLKSGESGKLKRKSVNKKCKVVTVWKTQKVKNKLKETIMK